MSLVMKELKRLLRLGMMIVVIMAGLGVKFQAHANEYGYFVCVAGCTRNVDPPKWSPGFPVQWNLTEQLQREQVQQFEWLQPTSSFSSWRSWGTSPFEPLSLPGCRQLVQ